MSIELFKKFKKYNFKMLYCTRIMI